MATINMHQAKDGTKTYRVRVRRRGHASQTASFPTLRAAKQWATMIEGQVIEGKHFPTKASTKHTLSELLTRYEEDIFPRKRPSTQRNQQFSLRYWQKQLGHLILGDITPSHIIGCRDALAKKVEPATVVKYLFFLSNAFEVAMKEYYWMSENPCRLVSKPKLPQGRVRYLSDEERQRLLQECQKSRNVHLYALTIIALCTGCRQGELLERVWRDADLDRGLLHLELPKNGHRRSVPLVAPALELLREMPGRDPATFIFPATAPINRWDSYRRSWEHAVKRAGLVDFHFHDLRHSAASYMVQAGVSLYVVGTILGHKSPHQMTARYAHLHVDNLREALTILSTRISR